MCVADRAEIAHDLLSYLVENRGARDTLDGIVEWWLLQQRIIDNTIEVKGVLDDLAAKDLIVEYETPDKRIHYHVNQRREKEILELLQGQDK